MFCLFTKLQSINSPASYNFKIQQSEQKVHLFPKWSSDIVLKVRQSGFLQESTLRCAFHIHQWSLYIHQWVSKTNLLIWKNFLNFFSYHYKLIFLSKHSMIFHCNYKFTSYIFTIFSFSYGAHKCLQMWLCIWGSMLRNRNCTLIRTAFFTSK